jgi:hypothetical protein
MHAVVRVIVMPTGSPKGGQANEERMKRTKAILSMIMDVPFGSRTYCGLQWLLVC